MAEPGYAQTSGWRTAPSIERIHRRKRAKRNLAISAAEHLMQRRHLGVRVAQTRQDRMQVTKMLARPARRRPDALEPRALCLCPQRLHSLQSIKNLTVP